MSTKFQDHIDRRASEIRERERQFKKANRRR